MSTQKANKSTILSFLYGENYEDALGNIDTGFIGFEKETGNNNTRNTAFRVIVLFSLLTNLTMALINSPLVNLAVYLTNWAMLLSLTLTLLVLKCSIDPHIKDKKGWLAATHIIFELASIVNAIVVTVYWLTIYSNSIK